MDVLLIKCVMTTSVNSAGAYLFNHSSRLVQAMKTGSLFTMNWQIDPYYTVLYDIKVDDILHYIQEPINDARHKECPTSNTRRVPTFGCEPAPGFPGVVVMKKCVCTHLSTYLCLSIHTHMSKSIKHKACITLLRS